MYKLNVTGKTGFRVKDVNIPIIIRDDRGILFYSTESLIPRTTEFNLPTGKYLVDQGYFSQMFLPAAVPNISLPKFERNMPRNPANFKIQFGYNPNKCSVNWLKGTITFDVSFKDKPMNQIDFIYYHEMGHRFYKTEKYCDLYAAKKMLEIGYNPSQVGMAPIDSLSNQSDDRKDFIIDNLI